MLDYPQVDLDFMNRDHAEFIELRKALLTSLAAGADTAIVSAQLDHLLEHTRRHFSEENRQMQAAGFPAFPVHKAEHERVLTDMEGRVAQWKQQHDNTALATWLQNEVASWFIDHVRTMDFITARFIKNSQG